MRAAGKAHEGAGWQVGLGWPLKANALEVVRLLALHGVGAGDIGEAAPSLTRTPELRAAGPVQRGG